MIKLVIQLADVHIRNIIRHEEYSNQLEKFIEMCKEEASKYQKEEVRILICGDLVHQKNNISNELIIFTSTFIRRLSEICHVLIYSGNHDLLVDNSSRTDTLTGIFETAQFDNVTYLDMSLGYKSGCVIDDGVTWALYSIHDNFNKPNVQETKELFPDNIVVGLYHGQVVGCQLANGFVAESGLDGDIFEDCDVVMAGDIHKRQVLKKDDLEIVYPGSLIQQTYGETVTQHGFVLWDIQNKAYRFVDLPSEYGLYNFEITSIDDIDNDNERLINY